jgi:hypothetical protein
MNMMRTKYFLILKSRCSHRDAQGFCFIATGNNASVVIGKNHDRFSVQIGTKNPLAGSIEIIAIHQGKHDITKV